MACGPLAVRLHAVGCREHARRVAAKRRHLRRRQLAPFAGAKARVADASDSHAPQPIDGVAQGVEHLADLAVPPLSNGKANNRADLRAISLRWLRPHPDLG